MLGSIHVSRDSGEPGKGHGSTHGDNSYKFYRANSIIPELSLKTGDPALASISLVTRCWVRTTIHSYLKHACSIKLLTLDLSQTAS